MKAKVTIRKAKDGKRYMRLPTQPQPTALVHFCDGQAMDLPYRHFCGGTMIKLPRQMADFRKQWVTLTYPPTNSQGQRVHEGHYYVGRHAALFVAFEDEVAELGAAWETAMDKQGKVVLTNPTSCQSMLLKALAFRYDWEVASTYDSNELTTTLTATRKA